MRFAVYDPEVWQETSDVGDVVAEFETLSEAKHFISDELEDPDQYLIFDDQEEITYWPEDNATHWNAQTQ